MTAMRKYFKENFLLFFLLFFLLLFDGSLQVILHRLLETGNYDITPALLLLAIVLLACYSNKVGQLYICSFLVGFLYDAYYSQVLGLCMFIFPFIVFLTRTMSDRFSFSFFTSWFWAVLVYGMYALLVFLVYHFLGQSQFPFILFLLENLIPSLLFNALFAFLFTFLMSHFAWWLEAS